MKLTDTYYGGDDPFEGDRKIWLRSLPAGARVTKAIVILTPAKAAGNPFEEVIDFPVGGDQDDWGATKAKGTGFCDVDFHARRMLVDVTGSGGSPELQVDMGGTLVSIAEDGTIFAPGKNKKIVKLGGMKDPLPSLTVNKIRFYLSSANLDVASLTIRSVPTNISLRLADKPPFWMRLGELAASQTSPDFAAVLNAFLADASVKDGYYEIPFVVHSDTIARLDVLLDIDYVIEEPVLPSYLPEITLPYSYGSLPGASEDLLTVKLPRGARPVSGTGGRIQGTFDSSRVVFGDIGESGAEDTIIVSPDSAMACPIQLEKETPVNGIDLPLANTDPGLAGLHLSLQEDLDGTPSGKILVEAEVKVARPVPGGSTWGSAQLPDEFRFLKDKRCWLVVQSLSGQAYWTVRPNDQASVALLASTDGGFSWRTAATSTGLKPLQAVFRLRHTPDHFTMPVQLQIGKGADARRARFDRFAPLGRVEFNMDFVAELNEYLAMPAAASPCKKGNLLVNGSFDLPRHTDATRRLFGFDAVESYQDQLTSKVKLMRGIDLSKERFITLSACENGKTQKTQIDCAGRNPAQTWPAEVKEAIVNAGFGADLEAGVLRILSCKPFLYPWMREEMPQGWEDQDESERAIQRIKMPTVLDTDWIDSTLINPRPERVAVILKAAKMEGEPATLSQSVPVVEGCAYVLRILFLVGLQGNAENLKEIFSVLNAGEDYLENDLEMPSWEVRWFDAEGELIHAESKMLSQNGRASIYIDGMLQSDFRLVAPPTATQAEIRFIQPPPGFVLLDDVSLTPTSEALSNGGFLQWEIEAVQPEAETSKPKLPVAWTRLGGELELYFDEIEQAAYAKLMGNGAEDAILTQKAQVKAGEYFKLCASARPEASPADDMEAKPVGQRARLELHWLADGAAKGEHVILPLDGRDFSTHSWAGEVPAGANGAEIRLIQPHGSGNLLVESVSLQHSDLVSVPLIFLSETPGELTVSNLKVTYELPEPPSTPSQVQSYSTMAASAASVNVLPSTAPRAITEKTLSVPVSSPLANLNIGVITGISEYTANILRSLPVPITSVAELAALNPEIELSDIPRERRLILKASAEMVKAVYLEAAIFSGLPNESLATLLNLTAEQLENRFGLQPEEADELQRNLRILKMLLKNDAFRKLSLSDLTIAGMS
jgi:hypothetical protein